MSPGEIADARTAQAPYLGMWQALCAWEAARHQLGTPIGVGELRGIICWIVDNKPAQQVYGRHGRMPPGMPDPLGKLQGDEEENAPCCL